MLEIITLESEMAAEMKEPVIRSHETIHMDVHARCVMSLIEKWGMVQGVDGGEDSAGRSKINLATVEETVSRAVHMVDMAFVAMREKGWVIDSPSYSQITADVEEKKAARKKSLEMNVEETTE